MADRDKISEFKHVCWEALDWLREAHKDKSRQGKPIQLGEDTAELLLLFIDYMTEQSTIRPMGTAPLNDGWILGLVDEEGRVHSHDEPWQILTRCDPDKDGREWCDYGGNYYSPSDWAILPDPQPKATGWRPVEGTICIAETTGDGWTDGKGNPVKVSWRWQIFIERSDGSCDEYRGCDFANTLDDAKAKADRNWVARYNLPVVIRPLDGKVVALRPRPKRLTPPDGPEAA